MDRGCKHQDPGVRQSCDACRYPMRARNIQWGRIKPYFDLAPLSLLLDKLGNLVVTKGEKFRIRSRPLSEVGAGQ